MTETLIDDATAALKLLPADFQLLVTIDDGGDVNDAERLARGAKNWGLVAAQISEQLYVRATEEGLTEIEWREAWRTFKNRVLTIDQIAENERMEASGRGTDPEEAFRNSIARQSAIAAYGLCLARASDPGLKTGEWIALEHAYSNRD